MKKYDVVGIGSPLLDFIFEIDDNILNDLGFEKGRMFLIDKEKSKEILKKLENHPFKISLGGSSSNTIAGIAFLGGKPAFLGKIGNDKNGEIYEEKTKESNVHGKFSKHPEELTGHTITFITSDFERTFATNLGASLYLRKEDTTEELIKESEILHIEGYQLENPELRETIIHSIKIAKNNNLKISLDLSDTALVKRNLSFLHNFIRDYVNIVFANESEAEAFTGKAPEEALIEISKICNLAIVKLGEKGSLIRADNKTYQIPAYKTQVINTNGAGDIYAAGILYSLVNGIDIEKAGALASYISSLVVASPGARLEKDSIEKINKFYFCKMLGN